MPFVPVNTPLLNGNELKYVSECIETNWVSSEGPFIKKFENAFSQYIGRKCGVAVTNGTAALELAFKVLNLKPGDEVILPAFTIISCVIPILRMGATPIFVDSDPNTWNVNVYDLKSKITPKTKIILAVHIYGLACRINEICEIAKENHIYVIEDAAEMHGQEVSDRKCGSFGDISIFSFYPNKHITTGEGGMLLTNDEEFDEKARWYSNLCFGQGHDRYECQDLGWNFRMTNLQAALGLAQLEQIEDFIIRKREIGNRYDKEFQSLSGVIQLPQKNDGFSENIYWVYGLLSKQKPVFEIMKHLADKKIGTRRFFCPLHIQPAVKKYMDTSTIKLPISEELYRRGFYIPSGLGLSEFDQNYVVQQMKSVLA